MKVEIKKEIYDYYKKAENKTNTVENLINCILETQMYIIQKNKKENNRNMAENKQIENYEWKVVHYKDDNKKDIFLSIFVDNNYIGIIREESEVDQRILNIAKHINVFL